MAFRSFGVRPHPLGDRSPDRSGGARETESSAPHCNANIPSFVSGVVPLHGLKSTSFEIAQLLSKPQQRDGPEIGNTSRVRCGLICERLKACVVRTGLPSHVFLMERISLVHSEKIALCYQSLEHQLMPVSGQTQEFAAKYTQCAMCIHLQQNTNR